MGWVSRTCIDGGRSHGPEPPKLEDDVRSARAPSPSEGTRTRRRGRRLEGQRAYFPLVCRRVLNRDMSIPLTYVIFDLLRRDGLDLTTQPYSERQTLSALELDGGAWMTSETLDDGPALPSAACKPSSRRKPKPTPSSHSAWASASIQERRSSCPTGPFAAALNVAARLCARARGGEVLVSEATTRLAGRLAGLLYSDRGRVNLKNISDPIHARGIALRLSEAPYALTAPVQLSSLRRVDTARHCPSNPPDVG